MTSIAGSPIFKGKSFAPKRASAPDVNSWDLPLTAGQSLLGKTEEVTLYPSVSIAVLTDGPGTVYLEQSMDEVNWDDIESVDIAANLNVKFVRTINRRYYRTRFVSSSALAHSFFRLQTMYGDFTSDGLGTGDSGQALRASRILADGSTGLIGPNVNTTIVTISPLADTFLTHIICSGHEYAKFTLVINSSAKFTRRSGPSRDVIWDFISPLGLSAGQIFDVKVIHFRTGETADFESTLMGY